ncbi:MAG: gluconate kinase [Meiothermus sp.]
MVVVLMGVAGSGKTTVGRLLAQELGWPFYDADDFHPPENLEKMRSGHPLTEEDRRPWLGALRGLLQEVQARGQNAVLACSALKQSFREALSEGYEVRFVYLKGSPELIAHRLAKRQGHFFPPELLASQLGALEPPQAGLEADITLPPEAVARLIRETLGMRP